MAAASPPPTSPRAVPVPDEARPVPDPEPDRVATFVAGAVEKVKHRGLKYSAVSFVNVIVGQGLLLFFHDVVHWGATRSNIAAVCVSAVPAYYLNRAWVWGKRGKSHFKREVLPFWVFVVIGLGLSSVLVTIAARIFPGVSLVPNIANLGAFGILWVLRFFVLDSLFHVAHIDLHSDDDPEGGDEPDIGAPPIL